MGKETPLPLSLLTSKTLRKHYSSHLDRNSVHGIISTVWVTRRGGDGGGWGPHKIHKDCNRTVLHYIDLVLLFPSLSYIFCTFMVL